MPLGVALTPGAVELRERGDEGVIGPVDHESRQPPAAATFAGDLRVMTVLARARRCRWSCCRPGGGSSKSGDDRVAVRPDAVSPGTYGLKAAGVEGPGSRSREGGFRSKAFDPSIGLTAM